MSKKDSAWVKTATTKQLVSFFNKKTGSNVKKFATRQVAEKRVLDAMVVIQSPYAVRKNAHGFEFNGIKYERIIHKPRPEKLRCAKINTKVDKLIGILKVGATMDEILLLLSSTGRAVTEAGARNWFNWPLNALHGYGVGIKNAKYVLIYPKGISKPLPNQFDEAARAAINEVKTANNIN